MGTHAVSQLAWERMVTAVEKVRDRLRRAAAALEQVQVPYAVVGGNAVAAWVSEVDESAVRNTQDVDILLRRADLPRAGDAFGRVGLAHRFHTVDLCRGRSLGTRDEVHVVLAGEKVRDSDLLPAPDVAEATALATCRALNLDALVQMKLVAFRTIDRVHLRDLIGVGLVDGSWRDRLPPVFAERLQSLLDNPEG